MSLLESSPKSPMIDALLDPSILTLVVTHLHIRLPCCFVRNLEEAYHTVCQLSETMGCEEHMQDLRACALVCKAWAAVANPQLWGHYAQLEHVLAILYDISPREIHYLEEAPSIISEKIDRFLSYAQYIRKLKIIIEENDQSGFQYLLIDASEEIKGRTLFPNLHTAVIVGNWLHEEEAIPVVSNIVSSSTRRLELGFYDRGALMGYHESYPEEVEYGYTPEWACLHKHLKAVTKKAPKLTEFVLAAPPLRSESDGNPMDNWRPETVLPSLHDLVTLHIPGSWVTKAMLDALAFIPHLEELRLQRQPDPFVFSDRALLKPRQSARRGDSHPPERKFRSLRSLFVHDTSKKIDHLLTSSFPKKHKLQRCYLTYYSGTPSAKFSQSFPLHFPHLQIFDLFFEGESPTAPINPASRTLLSRLSKNLTEVSLNSFSLTILELENLLDGWGNLKFLGLNPVNPRKVVFEQWTSDGDLHRRRLPGLTVESLAIIAKKLHKLETLRITLVASDLTNLPIPDGADPDRTPMPSPVPSKRGKGKAKEEQKTFRGLENLILDSCFFNYALPGFSKRKAALYISSLLPPVDVATYPSRSASLSTSLPPSSSSSSNPTSVAAPSEPSSRSRPQPLQANARRTNVIVDERIGGIDYEYCLVGFTKSREPLERNHYMHLYKGANLQFSEIMARVRGEFDEDEEDLEGISGGDWGEEGSGGEGEWVDEGEEGEEEGWYHKYVRENGLEEVVGAEYNWHGFD